MAGSKAQNSPAPDYSRLFDRLPGLYLILDPDLAIIAVNEAYARATMIDPDSVLGRNIFDVFPDNPDDPAADGVRNLRASLLRVLQTGRPDAMPVQKYDIRKPDGTFEERHWSPFNVPLLADTGAVEAIIHRVEDVTDLIRLRSKTAAQDQIARDQNRVIEELRSANAELARTLADNALLQREHAYLANIVESSNDAIVSRAADGTIRSWNRAAELMFGFSAAEMIGQTGKLPPDLESEAAAVIERLRRGEQIIQYETRRLHKQGHEVHVSFTASLMRNHEGEIIGTSGILRDITEKRQAEAKSVALQNELAHVSRLSTMGQVSAAIAHEVNQPLSAINNYLAVGQKLLNHEGGLSDGLQKARNVMEKAAAQALRAGSIIAALRDFVEKREGSRSLQSLPELVQEAVNLGMLGHKHGNIRLHMALDPTTPPMVLNKVQIQQVLVNLVRNALDAMAATAEPELGISLTADAGGTTIIVRDNGPGFPVEIADQLFQPFVTTKETGMGIGLRICQSIVEAHGGAIEATNTGTGALFVIRFPREDRKESRA
jgi:two-component system, LuxR family, sensor kinase FixL